MISSFWAFVVVWDGKIALWETLGFLLLYVVYICVVIFGRLVNQKIKLAKGLVIKNDFTKAVGRRAGPGERPKSLRSIQDSYNGEDDRSADEQDAEEQRRPLLDSSEAANVNTEDVYTEPNEASYSGELRASCNPVDVSEWKSSNIFSKSMLLVKIPVYYVLKMTIPLVDYDQEKNNWSKVTILINCLISPLFMVSATQLLNSKLFGILPVWSLAIILGVTLALLVCFLTDLQSEPKFYWVLSFDQIFIFDASPVNARIVFVALCWNK